MGERSSCVTLVRKDQLEIKSLLWRQSAPAPVPDPIFFGAMYKKPGGVLPEKLGRGVRPASQSPYPFYDQNLRFSLPYLRPDQKFDYKMFKQATRTMILLVYVGSKIWHPIYDLTLRSLGRKGFCCWLYQALNGVEEGKGADGRRRAWWRSIFL